MNEIYYDYIRQKNDDLLKASHLAGQLKAQRPQRAPLSDRFLLSLSDLLLSIGERIRPSSRFMYPMEQWTARNLVSTSRE